jgi:hypothetical protein
MNESARILNHYFALLAKRTGAKWTAANMADIARAVELLEAEGDELPAYVPLPQEPPPPPGYETVSFERPTSRDAFRQTRDMAEQEATRRMLRNPGH